MAGDGKRRRQPAVAANLDGVMLELGQFGKYQLINYLLIAVPVMFAACNNGNYVFTAADLDYRCLVPECESSVENATLEVDWLPNAMPSSTDPRRCGRFAPANNSSTRRDPDESDVCPADLFDRDRVIECDQFVFSDTRTIVYELQTQCEFWKRTFVGTIHSIGLLFALPIVGYVSDRYGRKIAFTLSSTLAGVFGLLRSFSGSYLVFVIFEFLEPLLGSGTYSSGFILGMEMVGPKRRVLGATILSMFYSLGGMLLGGLAWAFPYWRTLLQAIYVPSLLFVSYFFLVNESVRWLMSKGQYEKGISIIRKAAKVNGVTLQEKSLEGLYSNIETETELSELAVRREDEPPEDTRSPMRQALGSRIIMCRVAKCSFWWITCTLVYYGLSINSVSLTGNIYLNYMLTHLVELPAYLAGYYLLDRVGRKSTITASFIVGGFACVMFPFLPEDSAWLSLVVYLIGKFFITIAYGSNYVYTTELFPTPLRQSLMGTCSMIGRIGSIIAPQTPLLGEYMASLPSLIFGACSFISGILMFSSPETLNIKLPDTIEEAENISKTVKQKVRELQSS